MKALHDGGFWVCIGLFLLVLGIDLGLYLTGLETISQEQAEWGRMWSWWPYVVAVLMLLLWLHWFTDWFPI